MYSMPVFCRRPVATCPPVALPTAMALALLHALSPTCAVAQTTSLLPEVMVLGSPEDNATGATPLTVLKGRSLDQKLRGTLGETLENETGVTSSSYGPNASRPIIRGQDGDRVRILSNGTGTFDASAASVDHAVAGNPLFAEKIEILRGSAALRYGGNAIGGVVNVVDGRVPVSADEGVHGAVQASASGPTRANTLGAQISAANRYFALSADAFGQGSGNLNVPGSLQSSQDRNLAAPRFPAPAGESDPKNRLPNSSARSEGGSVGVAVRGDWGHLGTSYQVFRNNYGVGLYTEPNTRIAMDQTRGEWQGKLKLGGVFESLVWQSAQNQYQHSELDAGAVNTTFKNKGQENRFELNHRAIGGWKGLLGFHATGFGFSAVNAAQNNTFLPEVKTRTRAVYVSETRSMGALTLNAGARHETHAVSANDGTSATVGCAGAQSQQRGLNSASLGTLWALNDAHSLSLQVGHSERAPTYQELFACGEHAATQANEYGNPALKTESANQYELAWNRNTAEQNSRIGVYQQRFSNYIFLQADTLGALAGNGNRDPGFTDFAYQQTSARFRGLEAQHRWRLPSGSAGLPAHVRTTVGVSADLIRALDLNTGSALPRISPLRLGMNLGFESGRHTAGIEGYHYARQDRTAPGETPTDAYQRVNLQWRYRAFENSVSSTEVFARADNIFDANGRNHASFIKDAVPLPGRRITVGVKTLF